MQRQNGRGPPLVKAPLPDERGAWLYNVIEGATAFTAAVGMNARYVLSMRVLLAFVFNMTSPSPFSGFFISFMKVP